jgi:Phage integrase, N-terminal SAM-like domain
VGVGASQGFWQHPGYGAVGSGVPGQGFEQARPGLKRRARRREEQECGHDLERGEHRVRGGGAGEFGDLDRIGVRDANRDRHERFGGVATVRDWLYSWLASILGKVRQTTRQSYHSHVREYLSPGIGRIPLAELTTGQVQALFDALSMRLNRYAEPLTPATLQRIRATLRRALNMAVRERILAVNPALALVLPSSHRPRPTVWSKTRVTGLRAADPATRPTPRRRRGRVGAESGLDAESGAGGDGDRLVASRPTTSADTPRLWL